MQQRVSNISIAEKPEVVFSAMQQCVSNISIAEKTGPSSRYPSSRC